LKRNLKAWLKINNNNIEMNEFVEGMVAHVTSGAVDSLKGTDVVKTINITVGTGEVGLQVNKENVKLTPFANDIIAATLMGLISLLKGADEVDKLEIEVDAVN
jgi:hypothetical protein